MIKSKCKAIGLSLFLGLVLLTPRLYGYTSQSHEILLAKNEKALFILILPPNPSVTQKFAGSELKKYLKKISQADFLISSNQNTKERAIYIENSKSQAEEEYTIAIRDNNIVLSGSSDRTILYAVYDFLNRLGCRWIAPEFSFYHGEAEYVPNKSTLIYEVASNVKEQPVFNYRTLDVDQGRSHNVKNLKKIIDWMPKLRFNVLRIPMDYRGGGKVQWDKWRKELTPELKKRDLMIEVGGHGYQNFLNANMENGKLFKKHPDWFAKDSYCKQSPSKRLVFNTENSEAVQYFINNITSYLQEHPEIDIFDLWPPDVGRWAECPEWEAFGTPADRQARLANEVNSAIQKINPDIRLEILAYADALSPPAEVDLDDDILVDFCPINQSFEKQIYDTSSTNNSNYLKAIHSWRTKFKGKIGIYTYYRKYAWRSLPNVIPHYIQRDIQIYAKLQLKGISTYSEPADWATYELNHYSIGKVAWDPHVNLDLLINNIIHVRYGALWKSAKEAYALLENTIPKYSSIPFTELKSEEKIEQVLQKIDHQIIALDELNKISKDSIVSANVFRLLLLLKYAYKDLQIQHALASNYTSSKVQANVKKIVQFLKENQDKGLFLLDDENNLARYVKHYGIDE